MAAGMQEKTVAGLLADLGVKGFSGIAATIGSPNTKLVITVTQPAWAILADGTVLASELATTNITGLTSNAVSHLWLTSTLSGGNYAPVWTVAVSAPDATAIKIADVTIAGNVLSNVTNVAVGLQGLPISGVTSSELTALLAAIPTATVSDVTSSSATAVTATDIAAATTGDAAAVTAADATAAAGANPDKAEFDVVVGLANANKAAYNAAVTLLNEIKTDYNATVTLLNQTKADYNTAVTLLNEEKTQLNLVLARLRTAGIITP